MLYTAILHNLFLYFNTFVVKLNMLKSVLDVNKLSFHVEIETNFNISYFTLNKLIKRMR